jgi:hypothetical protein
MTWETSPILTLSGSLFRFSHTEDQVKSLIVRVTSVF